MHLFKVFIISVSLLAKLVRASPAGRGEAGTIVRAMTSSTPHPQVDVVDPFRSLLDASVNKSRKIRGGNYVQLATVTADGEPRVRTVVQRGIFPHGDFNSVFKFITDKRSEKVRQIQSQPKGELVWWFLKTSEQYRISGNLTLIGDEEKDESLAVIRKQTWGNLRDGAREQFYWPQPGLPLDEQSSDEKCAPTDTPNAPSDIPTGGRDENGKLMPPPGEFLVMLMWPSKIDYLRLTDNHRIVFERKNTGTWNTTTVHP